VLARSSLDGRMNRIDGDFFSLEDSRGFEVVGTNRFFLLYRTKLDWGVVGEPPIFKP
jgi:hypothetical protein